MCRSNTFAGHGGLFLAQPGAFLLLPELLLALAALLGQALLQPAVLWYIGVIEGIMEKKMETTMVYWGYRGDNGKENGNYYGILGL